MLSDQNDQTERNTVNENRSREGRHVNASLFIFLNRIEIDSILYMTSLKPVQVLMLAYTFFIFLVNNKSNTMKNIIF